MKGGAVVFVLKDISMLKRSLTDRIGTKVRLCSARGKQKPLVAEGVIDNVYPSIFTIMLYEGIKPTRKVSYSYTDVLTKSVEITLCE